MTYPHAVRYLTESVVPHPAMTAESVLAEMGLSKVRPLGIRLSGDKQGRACGNFLCSAFRAAGIRTLSVTENPAFPLRERLRADGEEIPAPLLASLCRRVREAELRRGKALASRPAGEIPAADLPYCLGSARRLSLVLAALLADSADPIPVLLFIGDADSPLSRAFSPLCPTLSRLVLVTAENADLSAVSPETRDVVSFSGGKELYNRLTDACARTGSRLNMVTEANCTCDELHPGGQTLTFRRAESGTVCLTCAAPSVLRAALLAENALLCAARQGVRIPNAAIGAGLSATRLPLYFSLREMVPPAFACSVDCDADLSLCCGDLSLLSSVLPRPITVAMPADRHRSFCRLLPEETRFYDRLLTPEAADAEGRERKGTCLYFDGSAALARRFSR